MCWYGSNSFRKTAIKDIVCYKVLKRDKKDKNKYLSYNFNFEYKFGELYKQRLSIFRLLHISYVESYLMIDDGFHSFDIESTFLEIKTRDNIIGFNVWYQKNLITTCYKRGYLLSLVECVIPKDCTYYENKSGLLVSDQIIINREIDCI